MSRPSRPTIVLGLLVGVVGISTSAVLARIAMGAEPEVLTAAPGAAPALAVAFWRTAGGALALAPMSARAEVRGPRSVSRRDHRLLALSGVALALHFACFQGALALTTVASAVTLATASPIFVALGSWWLLGERTTRRGWLAIALTVPGAIVIGAADTAGHPLGLRALTGDALAFGAALTLAAYFLVGRATRRRVRATTYSAVVYAWAALGLLAACLALRVPLTGYTFTTWLALAGIVLGPQLLGHTVFNTLLSSVSATVVALAMLTEPVGATLLAWALLAELPTPWFWVGAPLVLVGVGLATVGRRREREAGEVTAVET